MRKKIDPSEHSIIFGARLRGLRNERNYSMDELCDAFNRTQSTIRLNRSTVGRYEKGLQDPMASTIAALANFFRVSPLYLMGVSEDRNEPITINNSAVVSGNTASTLIVRNSIQNGAVQEHEMSEEETELFRIYESLNVRARAALLTAAYEILDKQLEGKL